MDKPLALKFDIPFSEAIKAAVKRKIMLPDEYYGSLQGQARQLAFTVAGLTSLDQVQQVKDSLDEAIKNGQSFNSWKKDMQESGLLNLPKHRLDNIYRTNMQGQYMAGKWEQFDRNKAHRPYLMYDAVNDSRVRPSHLALDGIIRPVDDPFFASHSPPNGYSCRCSLKSLTEVQAQNRSGPEKGLNQYPIKPDGTPANPDKGWSYSPRDRLAGVKAAIKNKQSQCIGLFSAELAGKNRHNKPIWCQSSGADQLNIIAHAANYQHEMPTPKQSNFVFLPEGLPDKSYLARFMAEFGALSDEQMIYESVTKHKLLVSGEMFTNHKTGESKITKHGREKYLLYIADAIKNPDEVWLNAGKYQDNALYFLSRYAINNQIMNVLAVFTETNKVWTGWTGYQNFDWKYFKSKRDGYLIYRNERDG